MQFSVNDMETHVIKLVRNAVGKCASTKSLPFNQICAVLGLDVKEGRLPPKVDGILQGRTILINSRIQNKERKQFTRFHEITHHLINEDEESIAMLHEMPWSRDDEYEIQLERLCNIGAAEFLMPREKFTKLYKAKGFNVELIPFAANHFESSAIATTIQLAQVAPNSCITAICEYGLISNETAQSQCPLFDEENRTPKPKLHVVYSALSLATKYWLARGTNIPDDHLVHQAFLEGQPLEGQSYVPFRSGNQMPCYCETLPDKDRNRVYVLFHLTPPPNPAQLDLFEI
jgi:Zn-dependent peptidase ImmA (M78 family)